MDSFACSLFFFSFLREEQRSACKTTIGGDIGLVCCSYGGGAPTTTRAVRATANGK